MEVKCGAIIFDINKTKILLVKNRECKKWGLPKGSSLFNEKKIDCAIREVKEETGFDIEKHGIITNFIKVDKYYYYIVYQTEKVKLFVSDKKEVKETKFIPISKIPYLYSNVNLKYFYKNFILKNTYYTR